MTCDYKQKENVLILGVTGQDGSYLAELLLKEGFNVIGITRRVSTSNTQRVKHLLDHPSFKLVGGDVTDFSSILAVVSKYKPVQIYNLSGQSHVGSSFDQPLTTWDITAKGCLNVLEVIRQVLPMTKYYFAASSEMFGDQSTYKAVDGVQFLEPGLRFARFQNEKTPFNPQSPYAISKLAGFHATRLYREAYGIYACNGILFNHESERRGENFVTRKVTKWIGQFIKNGSIEKLKLGNLESCRDWGHAQDYVKAMFRMLNSESKYFCPMASDYVIGTGETHSIEEFIERAFHYINKDWKQYVVIDESLKRPSEVPYLCADATKAHTILNWEPTIGFQELIEMMVENDINHA